jgi:hypothetical protein
MPNFKVMIGRSDDPMTVLAGVVHHRVGMDRAATGHRVPVVKGRVRVPARARIAGRAGMVPLEVSDVEIRAETTVADADVMNAANHPCRCRI